MNTLKKLFKIAKFLFLMFAMFVAVGITMILGCMLGVLGFLIACIFSAVIIYGVKLDVQQL